MITTYNAYEKGFLPSAGGVDDQPAMLLPIMATISSALEDERDYEKAKIASRKEQVQGSTSNAQGKVSLLNGPAR